MIGKTIRSILLLTILSFSLYARSPAVEPVSGLSIDQYEESSVKDPNQAGYDWTKSDASQPVGFQNYDLIDSKANRDTSFYVLMVSFALLPMMMVFVYRRRKKPELTTPDNVIDLHSHKSDDDDDRENYSKVS